MTTHTQRGIAIAIAFAVALTITGCTSAIEATTPVANQIPTTSRSQTVDVTPTTIPRGTSTDTAVKIGTAMTFLDSNTKAVGGSVVVHAAKTWSDPYLPSEKYVAIDAEVNLTTKYTGTQSFSDPTLWSAVDAANHVYTTSFMPGPVPQFPSWSTLRAGEAIRGWLLIETGAAVSALTFRFALDDGHYFWTS